MGSRTRYAVVGTGGRAGMYIGAICGPHRDTAELVGMCDPSRVRMAFYNDRLLGFLGLDPAPTYHPDAFDAMVAETAPDVVIVTSVDATHHSYMVRALDLGCDVVCEKPMTTTAEHAQAILDAVERTGCNLRVTFNYRYLWGPQQLRRLVAEGAVGRPRHVNFEWVLDTAHGADYFRRWHREKQHSGGLLVHKATHHFDLVNWWLDSWPHEVFAHGALAFYGRANAEARGERYTYDRYTGVAEAAHDPFAIDLDADPGMKGLYRDAEAETGYLRDRNVFGDGITAEDTMSVSARYRNGTILTYSLVAYAPWEGFTVAITGDRGRVELDQFDLAGMLFVGGEGAQERAVRHGQLPDRIGSEVRVYPMFGEPWRSTPDESETGHFEADQAILAEIFGGRPGPDPLGREATHLDGAASVLLGVAANEAIARGAPVRVDDLVRLPDPRTPSRRPPVRP
jgi:predicted dehydrogenase